MFLCVCPELSFQDEEVSLKVEGDVLTQYEWINIAEP